MSTQKRPLRIAIFRALQLGDLLVAVPAFRAIRAQYPSAEITLIGLPWARGFVQRYRQYLDRFVEFAGYPGIQEVECEPARVEHFIAEQREYGYDIAIQMHGSGQISNQFILALNSKTSVGYYPDNQQQPTSKAGGHNTGEGGRDTGEGERDKSHPYFDGSNALFPNSSQPYGEQRSTTLTVAAPYPEWQHEIQRNLGLASLLGCKELDARLEFPLYEEDHAEAAALLRHLPQATRPWVGLHPGSRPPARRWPATYFARLADELAERFGAHILLTGGPGEEATVRAVSEHMKTPAISLAGRTSLGGLGAVLSKLDLFVSNDTGPAHMACAIDCPSITLFGPADYQRWAPLDTLRHPTLRRPVACSPCGHWECPIDHRCLRWLTPETVIETAAHFLTEVDQRVQRPTRGNMA